MVRRILKNKKFLEYYLETDPKSRKRLLKGANHDQIKSLCEATLNVVKKNINVPSKAKQELYKHKAVIKRVAFKKEPISKKKSLLVQKGGFLPIILSTVLPLLANALLAGRNG